MRTGGRRICESAGTVRCRLLPLPAVWGMGVQPHRNFWWWLKPLATALALIPREDERLYAQALRGLLTWGVILVAVAAVVDWLK